MATVMTRPATGRRRTSRRVYVPIALACLVIDLLGFWPTDFGPLLARASQSPPIIIVFLGGRPPPLPQLLAVWLSPVPIGMAYDYLKSKTVQPVDGGGN